MRRQLLLISWLATDLILFLGAYAAAYFLRIGFINSTVFPLDKYLRTAVLVAPVWLIVLAFLNVYSLTRVQASAKNVAYLLFSSILALALFVLSYYFLYNIFFSRLLLVYAWILSFAITAVWHLAYDQWQRTILRRNPPAYPLLVIGANRDAERLITHLNERRSPITPVAVLDARGTAETLVAGVPVLGRLNKLEDVIREKRITHIAQCADLEHTINLVSVARQHGLTYMLLPSVLGIVGMRERSETVEGQPVFVVNG